MQRREAVEQAVGVGQARGVEQRACRGTFHQPARVHHSDLVGELNQQRQVVRDEEGRETDAVAQADQLLEDLSLRDHVQCRRRLVHDDHLRFESDRHRDHHALPHPT